LRERAFSVLLLLPIVILFLNSCGLRYTEENEMNDSFEAANLLFTGKVLKGSISSGNDVDFYNLKLKNPDKYHEKIIADIRLKNQDGINYELRVFNKKRLLKQVIKKSSEIALVNMMFNTEDLKKGKIFLVVSSVGKEISKVPSRYSLNVNIRSMNKEEEGEPDDAAVFAIPLVKEEKENVIRGYFNPDSNPMNKDKIEEDWYKYKVTYADIQSRDKSIKVNLNLTAVPDVDSEIAIFDDLGYLIRTGDSFGVGENERLLNIFLKEGTYYVRVRSKQPGQENVNIPYVLKIKNVENNNTESEPNDNYPMANLINFSEEKKGYFNPIGDIDWFRVNVYDVNPQILTVKAEPTAYIDYRIKLFSAANELIVSVDDRGEDEGEIIKNIGVGPGVYYIKLENKNQKKDVPQNQYSLTVYKNEWNNEEEYELNNDFNSANSFYLGTLKKGYITPVGDVDFYRFQLEVEKTVRFEISPSVLLDLYIEVYDSEGNLLNKIDSKGEGMGEEGDINLDSGIYFAKVGSNNKNENSRDFYILRIYPKE